MSDTAVAAPAAPKPFKIRKEIAVAIFGELGTPTAAKWPKERLEEKLAGLAKAEDAADTVLTDENHNGAFHALITAVTAGRPVDVTGFGAAPAPVVETGTDEGEEAPTPAEGTAAPAAAKPGRKKMTDEEKAAKKAERDAAKPAKAPAELKVRKATPHFLAGQIIKERGMEMPLAELVAEVDKRYGRENPKQTAFDCNRAFQVLRGYLGQ